MSFDIDQVLKDMTIAITGSAKESVGDIGDYAKDILDAKKETLKTLALAKRNNEIDDTVFDRELQREQKVVEVELLTIQIMTKAAAQKAVNAAIDVFRKAVKAAIL